MVASMKVNSFWIKIVPQPDTMMMMMKTASPKREQLPTSGKEVSELALEPSFLTPMITFSLASHHILHSTCFNIASSRMKDQMDAQRQSVTRKPYLSKGSLRNGVPMPISSCKKNSGDTVL